MSKYTPLWVFIKTENKDKLELTYQEIKDILGFNIDHSFLSYKKELLDYGFEIDKISMKNEVVYIKRK